MKTTVPFGLNPPENSGKFTFRVPCFHFTFHLNGNQFSNILSILHGSYWDILKTILSVTTLAATVAWRRNIIPVHLILWKQKSPNTRKTTRFQILVFPGKQFPSIMVEIEHKSVLANLLCAHWNFNTCIQTISKGIVDSTYLRQLVCYVCETSCRVHGWSVIQCTTDKSIPPDITYCAFAI
jgi:hypothetical protein